MLLGVEHKIRMMGSGMCRLKRVFWRFIAKTYYGSKDFKSHLNFSFPSIFDNRFWHIELHFYTIHSYRHILHCVIPETFEVQHLFLALLPHYLILLHGTDQQDHFFLVKKAGVLKFYIPGNIFYAWGWIPECLNSEQC